MRSKCGLRKISSFRWIKTKQKTITTKTMTNDKWARKWNAKKGIIIGPLVIRSNPREIRRDTWQKLKRVYRFALFVCGSFPDGDDTIYIFVKITLVCLFMLNALGLDSMTGKFWKFKVNSSPCANNNDYLSSSGQRFSWIEFHDSSQRGSWYILEELFGFFHLPLFPC